MAEAGHTEIEPEFRVSWWPSDRRFSRRFSDGLGDAGASIARGTLSASGRRAPPQNKSLSVPISVHQWLKLIGIRVHPRNPREKGFLGQIKKSC
jgi:hypothetical protein